MITNILKSLDNYSGSWCFDPSDSDLVTPEYWIKLSLVFNFGKHGDSRIVKAAGVTVYDYETDTRIPVTDPEKEIILKKINRYIYTEHIEEPIDKYDYEDAECFDVWRDDNKFENKQTKI